MPEGQQVIIPEKYKSVTVLKKDLTTYNYFIQKYLDKIVDLSTRDKEQCIAKLKIFEDFNYEIIVNRFRKSNSLKDLLDKFEDPSIGRMSTGVTDSTNNQSEEQISEVDERNNSSVNLSEKDLYDFDLLIRRYIGMIDFSSDEMKEITPSLFQTLKDIINKLIEQFDNAKPLSGFKYYLKNPEVGLLMLNQLKAEDDMFFPGDETHHFDLYTSYFTSHENKVTFWKTTLRQIYLAEDRTNEQQTQFYLTGEDNLPVIKSK